MIPVQHALVTRQASVKSVDEEGVHSAHGRTSAYSKTIPKLSKKLLQVFQFAQLPRRQPGVARRVLIHTKKVHSVTELNGTIKIMIIIIIITIIIITINILLIILVRNRKIGLLI
jgi:hypothetical protein